MTEALVSPAVEGRLKGFDTLVNLVLDECTEFMRGIAAPADT